MNAPAWLVEAGIYLAAAVFAVPIFKRLGLGSVLGYLIAGIVIGPHVLALVADPERVLNFAEFGVVLLLFLIGLELEPEHAWDLRKPLFGLGGLQVVATIAAVVVFAMPFHVDWRTALVAGMGIAMSSTAIGLASLEERKLLGTPAGQASFAVLLFQDLSVIPLFIVLGLIVPGGSHGMNAWAALRGLLVIAAIIVAGRTIVRPIMRIVAQTGLREVFIAFALLLVVGVAIAVQSVGLSMALGTFLAGLLLADSEYRYELRLDVDPAKGLLLGLFFIAVGMSVDLHYIATHPWMVLGLAVAVVAGKWLLLNRLGNWFYCGKADARLFATALSQIGEFAFVIFNVALGSRILDRDAFNALNAAVAVSMLSTPLLLFLYERFTRRQFEVGEPDRIETQRPVIVAGFGRFGQIVTRVLNARGVETTMIDRDPNQIELLRGFGWRCYYGDASRMDLLEEAGIATARLFVLAIDDPDASIDIAKRVRERWPDVPIIARARGRTDAYELEDLGIKVVRETFYSSLEAAKLGLRALGETAHTSWRVVKQFERHDVELFAQMRTVRNDRQAIVSLAEQARRDLDALIQSERGMRRPTDDSVEEVWAHVRPPDDTARTRATERLTEEE